MSQLRMRHSAGEKQADIARSDMLQQHSDERDRDHDRAPARPAQADNDDKRHRVYPKHTLAPNPIGTRQNAAVAMLSIVGLAVLGITGLIVYVKYSSDVEIPTPVGTWKAAEAEVEVGSGVGSTGILDIYGGKTLAPSNFSVVHGLFRQSDPDFNGTDYDVVRDGFGLLATGKERWREFTRHITHLNNMADAYTTYKVVYLARHGEGYHNTAERKYGSEQWNCRWAMLNGDGVMTWGPDPQLTPLGEAQARAINAGWKTQIADHAPVPQTLYSSPFRRAASTLDITWRDILLHKGVRPVIKENLRESIGLHTCDLRSPKTSLRETYPDYDFEPSFTEHDILWDSTYQETLSQQAVRVRLLLNEIFATDPQTFISITAHSGVINAFFLAVGHHLFQVETGGFVPVVLKATSNPSATFSPIVKGQSATAPACKRTGV